MCKHIAATLYGIGARLDASPELLFLLRQVDASELIAKAGEGGPAPQKAPSSARMLDASKLTELFGIDVGGAEPEIPRKPAAKPHARKKNSPSRRKKKAATRPGARAARKNPRN
jgi:uncharacterized Zn finger protein